MAMLNSQRVYSWENHEFWVPYFQTTPFPCTGMLTASAHLNKWAESNYSTQLGHVDSYHITSYLTSVQELSAIVETLIYIDHIYIYIHIRICQATCDPSGWFLLLHSWKPWVSLTHEALHYSMDLNFCVVSNDKEWTLSLCPYISLNCCPCLAIHLPTAGVFIEIPKLNMSTITIKNVSRLVL